MIFGSDEFATIGPIFDFVTAAKLIFMKLMIIIAAVALFHMPATRSDPGFPVDPATGKITWSGVVLTDSEESLGDIWPLAFEWMVKNSETEVIQIDNGEVAKLIGRSKMQIFSGIDNYPAGHINFSITISVKDGRYKYEFSDFVHTGQMLSENVVLPDLGPCEQLLSSLNKVEPWFTRKHYLYITQQVENDIRQRIAGLQRAIKAGLKEAEAGW